MTSFVRSRSLLAVAALVALGACSSDSKSSSVAPVTDSVATAGSLPEPVDPQVSIAVETLPLVTVTPDEPAATGSTKPVKTTSSTKPGKQGTSTSSTAASQETKPSKPDTKPVKDTWKKVAASQVAGVLAVPCCGDNFHGAPSPALPAAGADLADGDYFAAGEFRKVPSKPLKLKVFRLEACSKIPESCEDFGDDATAMGIDRSAFYEVTLPLDKSLRVVFTGFRGMDSDNNTVVGTGADLAALATALNDSYAENIGSRIAKGQSPRKVLTNLAANPAGGWEPAPDNAGELIYTYGSAPPVLLQGVPESGHGADLIGIVSLHVEGGKVTLLTYGGFYS